MARLGRSYSRVTIKRKLGRDFTQTFSDSVTLVESMTKAVGRALSDAVTLVDITISSTVGKGITLLDSITLSDSLTKAVGRSLSDTLSLTDSLLRGIGKSFSDALHVLEIFSTVVVFARKPIMLGTKLLKPLFSSFNRKPKASTKAI